MNIKELLTSCPAYSGEMINAMRLWGDIYRNEAPWKARDRRSLNLGKAIAREFARLVLLEAKITVNNSDGTAALMSDMVTKLRPHFEKALAKGGMAFKPYRSGGRVYIDFVDAENFFPITYDDDGNITAAVFMSRIMSAGKRYIRLEYHIFDRVRRTEEIYSEAYTSATGADIGRKIKLTDVPAWQGINEHEVISNIDGPLFSYFRVPYYNTVDDCSPLGISIFADAAELIEDADKQYDRYLWEYEAGSIAIYADTTALNEETDENGEKIYSLPSVRSRLVRTFGGMDRNGTPFYKEFAPTLRDASYAAGLEKIFRQIEFSASLAFGTLSDVQSVDKTAEEIKASKQRSYTAVLDIQTALQSALRQLAEAVRIQLAIIGSESIYAPLDISFMWDDSLIRDTKSEFVERLQLLSGGVVQAWEMRSWYLGESEQQAKKMCAEGIIEDFEE